MKNMRLLIMAALPAIFIFMITACQQPQPKVMKAKQIPLEDFFKNPDKTGIIIAVFGQVIIDRHVYHIFKTRFYGGPMAAPLGKTCYHDEQDND